MKVFIALLVSKISLTLRLSWYKLFDYWQTAEHVTLVYGYITSSGGLIWGLHTLKWLNVLTFRGTYCLHFHGDWIRWSDAKIHVSVIYYGLRVLGRFGRPEDGGSTFLRNIRTFNHHTLQKPKWRPSFCQQPPWQPENENEHVFVLVALMLLAVACPVALWARRTSPGKYTQVLGRCLHDSLRCWRGQPVTDRHDARFLSVAEMSTWLKLWIFFQHSKRFVTT